MSMALAQHVEAGAKAPGSDVRAGWKVLRALGGLMKLPGFEFDDLAGLRAGITEQVAATKQELCRTSRACRDLAALRRGRSIAAMRCFVVRRALQAHPLNRAPAVRVNAEEAQRQGLVEGGQVQACERRPAAGD